MFSTAELPRPNAVRPSASDAAETTGAIGAEMTPVAGISPTVGCPVLSKMKAWFARAAAAGSSSSASGSETGATIARLKVSLTCCSTIVT